MMIEKLNEHLRTSHGLIEDPSKWAAEIFHAHQHCNEDHSSCSPPNHTAKCNKLDDWFFPPESAQKNYPNNYNAHKHSITSD